MDFSAWNLNDAKVFVANHLVEIVSVTAFATVLILILNMVALWSKMIITRRLRRLTKRTAKIEASIKGLEEREIRHVLVTARSAPTEVREKKYADM